jgi:hypothetical protein
MRRTVLGLLVLAWCVVGSVSAKAQERVPQSGFQAVGFDFGVFIPWSDTGDQLDVATPVSGFYEYYVTPRVSLRGSTGWTQPSRVSIPRGRHSQSASRRTSEDNLWRAQRPVI